VITTSDKKELHVSSQYGIHGRANHTLANNSLAGTSLNGRHNHVTSALQTPFLFLLSVKLQLQKVSINIIQ